MSVLTAEQTAALVDWPAAEHLATKPADLAEVLWGLATEEPGSDVRVPRTLLATLAAATTHIANTWSAP